MSNSVLRDTTLLLVALQKQGVGKSKPFKKKRLVIEAITLATTNFS
jgi:hypothetical protein